MKFSIQTDDPLKATTATVPIDELDDEFIWLPAPVSVRAALQLLNQLYPSLRWSGGERLTQFTPPDDINGLVVVRYGNNDYVLSYTRNATSDSPFRILPGPMQLVRITE